MDKECYQAICYNGHQRTVTLEYANLNDDLGFCKKCGEPVICKCPECGTPIEGWTYYDGVIAMPQMEVPKYCVECGKPFEWTNRSLSSFDDLLDLEDQLSDNDKSKFKKSISYLSGDGELAKTNASIAKIYLSRASSAVGPLLYNFLVDFSSETAKKILEG